MVRWNDIAIILSRLITEAENHKDINKYRNRESDFKSDLKILFELGGIISGGAALGMLRGVKIKDIDIYFNNEKAYKEAYLIGLAQPRIDPCFYVNDPYELHDLSCTMLTMDKDGKFVMTPEINHTLATNICTINTHNLVDKEKTAKRILKYNKKYGFQFRLEEVIPIFASSGVELNKSIAQQ